METALKILKAIFGFLWKCILFALKALIFVIVCEVMIMGFMFWIPIKYIFLRPFFKKRTKVDDSWRRGYEWAASYW